ncbi:MAG: hypothetical protein WD601_09560 [Pseudohongiellaceae bacterium]
MTSVLNQKPEIAVLFHLARTGGTLISKCLGCIGGNVLLSEVNPEGSVMHPLLQAYNWHGLFTADELQPYLDKNASRPDYLETIRFIHRKTLQLSQKLIVRDWSHLNFTGVPYTTRPCGQALQHEVLSRTFSVHAFATVRHPLDTYLSLSRLQVVQGKLTVKSYLAGCKQFALFAAKTGFVRYEDFCREPQRRLQEICQALSVHYQEDFLHKFHAYQYITGDTIGKHGQSDAIAMPKRRQLDPTTEKAFQDSGDYHEILQLLGYRHELT